MSEIGTGSQSATSDRIATAPILPLDTNPSEESEDAVVTPIESPDSGVEQCCRESVDFASVGENSYLEDEENMMTPLVSNNSGNRSVDPNEIRSRKKSVFEFQRLSNQQPNSDSESRADRRKERLKQCCNQVTQVQQNVLRSTITVMNFLARILFWVSLVAMTVGVIWYSKELAIHGTDPHLIAWFSAGAFVILGFPISIYGILMHLTNYYQPNIQCYVVRILWMVPLYSIESWLCLRFHKYAIYIETLRDCYESFVLYCFLQFLIEVLGGEEALIMMLKDKSPTRGVHYVPLHWCMKPWIMGQPVSRTVESKDGLNSKSRIQWTSPFFVKCKFGVLQYVLLKFVSSIFVMILEVYGLYKEGNFTPKGGYLYICILTNTSQCWALYCLVFFYYATKNELGPIRPVGKFLSVKALVFFTWWQSVLISIMFQAGIITQYKDGEWSAEDVAKGLQDYLICVEMFIGAIVHTFVFPHTDYMKPLATTNNAMVKTSIRGKGIGAHGKRLGRKGRSGNSSHYHGKDDRSICSKTSTNASTNYGVESLIAGCSLEESDGRNLTGKHFDPVIPPAILNVTLKSEVEKDDKSTNTINSSSGHNIFEAQNKDTEKLQQERTGFVRAFIDSTVPRDVMNSTVGIARGDFTVEKKTLLYHAATSDEYELFSKRRRAAQHPNNQLSPEKSIGLSPK